MSSRRIKLILFVFTLAIGGLLAAAPKSSAVEDPVDRALTARLRELGFTGNVEATLQRRLGRRLNLEAANLGRLLWFDTITGLNDDKGLSLSYLPHLLVAQAFIPPTERVEVAGFDFPGDNHAIRNEVLNRLNSIPEYRQLFGRIFPEVRQGAPINFDMFGKATAEFEFALTFAHAPIDLYARGLRFIMTEGQKKGALLFFGIAPVPGDHNAGNMTFDGPGRNEDFGLEQNTGNPADRYKFRTSPLRNVGLQPTFFHNGAFTRLEDAIRHHLNVYASARNYNPAAAGVDRDLRRELGPIEPVLERLDPILRTPIHLTETEFRQLVDFVRNGLLDPRARPEVLRFLVPKRAPNGRPVLNFQF